MITQGYGIVAHILHNVDDILAVRDGASQVALQKVAHANHSHYTGIATHNGVAQTTHLGVPVDAAMYVVVVKNNYRFLSVVVNVSRVIGGAARG